MTPNEHFEKAMKGGPFIGFFRGIASALHVIDETERRKADDALRLKTKLELETILRVIRARGGKPITYADAKAAYFHHLFFDDFVEENDSGSGEASPPVAPSEGPTWNTYADLVHAAQTLVWILDREKIAITDGATRKALQRAGVSGDWSGPPITRETSTPGPEMAVPPPAPPPVRIV